MPAWLPDPLWPWLLGFAVVAGFVGIAAGHRPLIWTAGLVAAAIAVMQLPLQEPHRWLYAAFVYLLVAVALKALGFKWPLVAISAVVVGYFALALIGLFNIDVGQEFVWGIFGVTEFGVILAILLSGWGLGDVIRSADIRPSVSSAAGDGSLGANQTTSTNTRDAQ